MATTPGSPCWPKARPTPAASEIRDATPVQKIDRAPDIATDDLRTAINEVEISGIKDALTRFKGNKKKAAESLGISRSYLYKKLALMNDGAGG